MRIPLVFLRRRSTWLCLAAVATAMTAGVVYTASRLLGLPRSLDRQLLRDMFARTVLELPSATFPEGSRPFGGQTKGPLGLLGALGWAQTVLNDSSNSSTRAVDDEAEQKSRMEQQHKIYEVSLKIYKREIPNVEKWEEVVITGSGGGSGASRRVRLDPRLPPHFLNSSDGDAVFDDWDAPLRVSQEEDPLGFFRSRNVGMTNPLLIRYLKEVVLVPPSEEEYELAKPDVEDPSDLKATSKIIFPLLADIMGPNAKEGVFFEAGALDGETSSRTLFLERVRGWRGLAVEMTWPNARLFLAKRRRCWFAPVCISPSPWPERRVMRFLYDPKTPSSQRSASIVSGGSRRRDAVGSRTSDNDNIIVVGSSRDSNGTLGSTSSGPPPAGDLVGKNLSQAFENDSVVTRKSTAGPSTMSLQPAHSISKTASLASLGRNDTRGMAKNKTNTTGTPGHLPKSKKGLSSKGSNEGNETETEGARVAVYSVVDCFPLYSLLYAADMTHVDFFNLDLEGVELQVLESLPLSGKLLDLSVVVVQTRRSDEKQTTQVRKYMESNDYKEYTMHVTKKKRKLTPDEKAYLSDHLIFFRNRHPKGFRARENKDQADHDVDDKEDDE